MTIKLFSDSPRDAKEQIAVYSVWIVMVLIAITFMIHYSTRIPLAEDWLMIAPLTGNEPDLGNWLWSQVNEHRIPFPRLIYLILLMLMGGDFTVGGYFNIALLSFISLLMIFAARLLRGNQTHFSDIFFPIAWLHVGHSANFLMGWQVTQVVPTILVSLLLLIFIVQKTFATPSVAILSGISLVLLPLCGANGLLYVPLLAFWLTSCGILQWRASQSRSETPIANQSWISFFLVGSSVASLGITGLYFVNYHPATWSPPSPSIEASLMTGIKLLAYGWGPAVLYNFWIIPVIVTVSLLLLSLAIIANAIFRTKGMDRYQAIGIFCFFGNLILFSLAVGHSRAGWIPQFGLPLRYVLFAVPTLSAVFFVSELYGTLKYKTIVQGILCFGMILLLPFNITGSFYGFTSWYQKEAVAMENDIFSGDSPGVLAARWKSEHDGFVSWTLNEAEVLSRINMLREAGIEPFVQIREKP